MLTEQVAFWFNALSQGTKIFLGTSPISWMIKKQLMVSRSFIEAMYRSMAIMCCKLKWLRELLRDLRFSHTCPVQSHCDSQVAMHITANLVFHECTKDIEVNCHFSQNKFLGNRMTLTYVPSQTLLADIFTKVLDHLQFHKLLHKLRIQNLIL